MTYDPMKHLDSVWKNLETMAECMERDRANYNQIETRDHLVLLSVRAHRLREDAALIRSALKLMAGEGPGRSVEAPNGSEPAARPSDERCDVPGCNAAATMEWGAAEAPRRTCQSHSMEQA